jgi:hypothetical protein
VDRLWIIMSVLLPAVGRGQCGRSLDHSDSPAEIAVVGDLDYCYRLSEFQQQRSSTMRQQRRRGMWCLKDGNERQDYVMMLLLTTIAAEQGASIPSAAKAPDVGHAVQWLQQSDQLHKRRHWQSAC